MGSGWGDSLDDQLDEPDELPVAEWDKPQTRRRHRRFDTKPLSAGFIDISSAPPSKSRPLPNIAIATIVALLACAAVAGALYYTRGEGISDSDLDRVNASYTKIAVESKDVESRAFECFSAADPQACLRKVFGGFADVLNDGAVTIETVGRDQQGPCKAALLRGATDLRSLEGDLRAEVPSLKGEKMLRVVEGQKQIASACGLTLGGGEPTAPMPIDSSV